MNKILKILPGIALLALTIECFGQKAATYQCLPCGQACDQDTYHQPGKCQHCQMDLVKISTITFKTIEPSKVCAYIKSHPNIVLLDVRTADEFNGIAEPNFGTLKKAINAPIQVLENDLTSIAHLKGREILVFCSHSHRSPRVSYLLTQSGFKNVTNMAGGMSVMPSGTCVKKIAKRSRFVSN
jgi:rhodanese-related sulfurtransferase